MPTEKEKMLNQEYFNKINTKLSSLRKKAKDISRKNKLVIKNKIIKT